MRAALVQMSSGDDPEANLARLRSHLEEAAQGGAQLACTPEVTNIVAPRERLRAMARSEADDLLLRSACHEALRLSLWIALGSLALRIDGEDRLANRSILIAPDGTIAARYDKIHMFDVDVSAAETWRESSSFRPGTQAVMAATPIGVLGLTICYDVRFPHLHRALAKAGAEILLSPAAFTRPTGEAHWEVLLRARAIETGCFVLAAAQTGEHVSGTTTRLTHGHSLAISPWGEVLADAGTEEGVTLVDLDLAQVAAARARIPALAHDRAFQGLGVPSP